MVAALLSDQGRFFYFAPDHFLKISVNFLVIMGLI